MNQWESVAMKIIQYRWNPIKFNQTNHEKSMIVKTMFHMWKSHWMSAPISWSERNQPAILYTVHVQHAPGPGEMRGSDAIIIFWWPSINPHSMFVSHNREAISQSYTRHSLILTDTRNICNGSRCLKSENNVSANDIAARPNSMVVFKYLPTTRQLSRLRIRSPDKN